MSRFLRRVSFANGIIEDMLLSDTSRYVSFTNCSTKDIDDKYEFFMIIVSRFGTLLMLIDSAYFALSDIDIFLNCN